MIRGFYSAAAGMMSKITQQDAIANNLANVNTPGYKRKVVGVTNFELAIKKANAAISDSETRIGVPILQSYEDQRPGAIQNTGSPTNFALDGPGHFVVKTGDGERLARGGNFSLDAEGTLVASDGSPVLGERGPIRLTGTDWSVDEEGNVHSSGSIIDRLRIEKSADASDANPTRVISGCLEASNVNAVEEMVSMITAMRSYESCQKAIQSLDQTLDKVINQMSK
jgi:flagellar basal-body rod protein FlgF